jgi:hypothetical protein
MSVQAGRQRDWNLDKTFDRKGWTSRQKKIKGKAVGAMI